MWLTDRLMYQPRHSICNSRPLSLANSMMQPKNHIENYFCIACLRTYRASTTIKGAFRQDVASCGIFKWLAWLHAENNSKFWFSTQCRAVLCAMRRHSLKSVCYHLAALGGTASCCTAFFTRPVSCYVSKTVQDRDYGMLIETHMCYIEWCYFQFSSDLEWP